MDLQNERTCSMEELVPLMQEQLKMGQRVRFSPRGVSMLPMLRHGKDQVELAPPAKDPQKYDVILYKRTTGMYVLHRVVKTEGERIYCLGDHLYAWDPPILKDAVIGIVCGFWRKSTYRSVENGWYRLYCRIWVFSYPLRRFLWRGIGWIKRRIK